MSKRNLFNSKQFGRLVKFHWEWQGCGIRKAAKEARVSPATFSRVARGGVPSVEVFFRLSAWMGVPKPRAPEEPGT